ncbi:MAG TPA: hypothetical protein VFU38_07275 [Candidatus Krumholzibacteria bacterium]|nr:hypothetical protein [Candidatus Krumholzibacteria bacterium]
MVALMHRVPWAALALALACSTAPPAETPDEVDELWGDEYEGVTDDADLEDTPSPSRRTGASIDVLADAVPDEGERVLRSLGASVRTEHSGARYRENTSGRAGAIEVFDHGPLQHVAIGFVRPSVGEGAILADARELGTPSARATSSAGVVRATPSSSRWGSVLGAAATTSFASASVSLAAWRPHDDDTTWTAWSGVERRFARTRVGAAAGWTRRQPARQAGSLTVVHGFRSAIVCAEAGVAGGALAYAARAAAGDAWYAAFSGGAAGAATASAVRRGDRRIAMIERRDRIGAMSTRVIASTVVRRDGIEEDRQRRIEARVQAAIADNARAEASIRFVESVRTELPTALSNGHDERRGQWRARASLRTMEHPSSSTAVEHPFRIDAVRERSLLGLAGTWRGKLRHGPVDLALEASAWGLEPGQLGYLNAGAGGLPGSGSFTAVSGGGSRLSCLFRARFGAHASIAAEWGRAASGDEDLRVGASFRW